ncbi:MAG TPA: hypothetical protein VF972_05275, partial [Actinomycetota bacterium]
MTAATRSPDGADDWSPTSMALYGIGQVGTMLGLAARARNVVREIQVADPDRHACAASRARGLVPDADLDPD